MNSGNGIGYNNDLNPSPKLFLKGGVWILEHFSNQFFYAADLIMVPLHVCSSSDTLLPPCRSGDDELRFFYKYMTGGHSIEHFWLAVFLFYKKYSWVGSKLFRLQKSLPGSFLLLLLSINVWKSASLLPLSTNRAGQFCTLTTTQVIFERKGRYHC